MRFPDIDSNDLTPDDKRMWLTVLLSALGDQSDDVVTLMSDATVHAMLYNLVSTLRDEEVNLGNSWLQALDLE